MQRADGHKRFLRFEIFEDTAPLARRGKLPLILHIPELLYHWKTIIKEIPYDQVTSSVGKVRRDKVRSSLFLG